MSKIENVSAKSGRTTKKNLSWTDEETALLLQVIIDYKSSKAALGLDWETSKSKYDDICERLQSRYPKERDEIDPEEYPHYTDPSVITREKCFMCGRKAYPHKYLCGKIFIRRNISSVNAT